MSYLPVMFSNIIRKARKEHRCYQCKRVILVGENYHHQKGNWDSKWDEFRVCMECENLRYKLRYDGEYAPFGDLMEWKSEDERQVHKYENGRI